MNLQSNDFELFGLTPAYAQDCAQLDVRWKDLQRQAHPDRFAGQGAPAQRLALQWSVRINQAYQRLKDPLKRAAYLCEINGAALNAENNSAMPVAFLQQQMQWRDELDEANCLADLEKINLQCQAVKTELLQKIAQLLDLDRAYAQAADQVRALMFIEKFSADLSKRLALLQS